MNNFILCLTAMNKMIGNFFHEKYWFFFNHCMSLSTFQNIEKDEFAQICYKYNSGLKMCL